MARFSLVLATLNRTVELERFVHTLNRQDASVQLIVIDQNKDDRLVPILAKVKPTVDVLHLRSSPGLSHARNVGLKHIDGDIVAFPDDDCWYPDGVLKFVETKLAATPDINGLTGRSTDGEGKASAGNFDKSSGLVDLKTVWGRGISFAIFVRRKVADQIGDFDESLGVGAGTRFGSGEETDYLIRGLKLGARLWYDPALIVFHPNPVANYDIKARTRGYSYGLGMGRVLSKHHYPVPFLLRSVIRPLAGCALSAATFRFAKAAYHLSITRGRFLGIVAKP